MPLTRRTLVHAAALALGAGLVRGAVAATGAAPAAARPLVEVWKSPSCGCCKDWVSHLEREGFAVKVTEVNDTPGMRARLGMPQRYGSCHTARVQGYLLEGHVPAREVHRLLKEKPVAIGLAVPAMPVGSPGMDGPEYGGRKDPYDVLLVQRDGGARVYQAYR